MRIWFLLMLLLAASWAAILVPETTPPDINLEEQRRCQERMQRLAVVQQLRSEAIDDFLANRATRAQTAERFRQIARDDPFDVEGCLQLCYPEASTEE